MMVLLVFIYYHYNDFHCTGVFIATVLNILHNNRKIKTKQRSFFKSFIFMIFRSSIWLYIMYIFTHKSVTLEYL